MPTLQPPSVPVFTAGTLGPQVPGVLNASIRDPFTFLLDPPTARLRRTTALTVAENVHQYIAWNVADEDSAGGWSAVDPTKYTVQAPGWYQATATVSLFGTGAAGLVIVGSIAVNGASPTGIGTAGWEGSVPYVPVTGSTDPKISSSLWDVYANVGDYIQVDLWYSTESTITAVDVTAGRECSLRLVHAGI
jgi:hypothetical protein